MIYGSISTDTYNSVIAIDEQKALNLKENRTRYRGGFGGKKGKRRMLQLKYNLKYIETSNNKESWVTCMSVSQTEAFSSRGLQKKEKNIVFV